MTDLTRAVYESIDANTISAIARQLGVSPTQAEGAVQQALPMLIGGLARNAQSAKGAEDLFGALQRDHQGIDIGGLLGGLLRGAGGGAQQGGGLGDLIGSVMKGAGGSGGGGLGDLIGGVLGGGGRSAGAGTGGADIGGAILGHIFGARRDRASDSLGQASGIGGQNAGQLLAMLAPIVMAALAKWTQSQRIGASGLGPALGQEQQRIDQAGAGGLIGSVLDRDGDGKVDAAELLQAGLGAIQMFGRR